ncbi:MAG: NAD(P)H-dependent oxidoreductase [Pseudomonadota bacterium]
MNIAEDLRGRAETGRPVRIGLIGAGEMGTDIVAQVSLMKGLQIAALAEVRIDQAWKAFRIAGLPEEAAVVCETTHAIETAVRSGKTAMCPSAELVCICDFVDVVIDATGNPNVGAQVAMQAIAAGKHIVMMNVEADVTIGAYLRGKAEQSGVVYTLGAGDEPSSTMELINFVRSLGYPVVAAGKGKNNAFNVSATPDEYREEALRRNMNPRMLVEFVDGSKTMIEMTAIANATGLLPDKPGMHGPNAPLAMLHTVLCPKDDGGILSRKGVVDFTVAKGVAPGVFVVAEMSHPRLRERMNDLQLGPGPYYTFFRPYHLTSLEVPLSAAAAVLYGHSHMRPLETPVAECAALAKKDLPPGTNLDAIGEYCYRGWAVTRELARSINAVPLGLAQGAVTTTRIGAGEYLTHDNCRVDERLKIVELRRLQDRLFDNPTGARGAPERASIG